MYNPFHKYVKEKITEDHFVYLNMNDNICTHKFRKGKRDGEYCCKKITINGNKTKYVCTKHNKDHFPNKRKIKNVIKSTINDNLHNIPNKFYKRIIQIHLFFKKI